MLHSLSLVKTCSSAPGAEAITEQYHATSIKMCRKPTAKGCPAGAEVALCAMERQPVPRDICFMRRSRRSPPSTYPKF